MNDFIVHSFRAGNDVVHNIQSQNKNRVKKAKAELLAAGYEIHTNIMCESGIYSVMFWTLHDRGYSKVPKTLHTHVLKTIKYNTHLDDVRPDIISTYYKVPVSSRTKSRNHRVSV